MISNAQIVVSVRIVGIKLDRSLPSGDCLVQTTQSLVHRADVAQEQCRACAVGERLLDQLRGGRKLVVVECHQPQQMQRVRLLRLGLQDCPQQLLGIVVAPRLLVFGGHR